MAKYKEARDAKKEKEKALAEEAAKAAETKDTAEKTENAAEKAEKAEPVTEGGKTTELPESVTLTKEEFLRVKERIDALEKEKNDNVALLKRLQADFDNYRKRNQSISADSLDEGARNVIKALLPVIDNFERAIQAAPEGSFTDGVKLVNKQLLDILKKNGMEEIEATGAFDPELHEAVLQEEAEGKETGDIVEVLQKGYRVKNRIIRHSMVKVAK